MRRFWLLLVLAGCSFSGKGSLDDAPPASDGTVADVPVTIDVPMSDVDAPTVRVPCTAMGPGIVACFEFEDAGATTLLDSASHHFDATTSGTTHGMRDSTSAALVIGASSSTYAPQDPMFDRKDGYTISVWIRPTALPSADGEVQGIVDHEEQYAMLFGHANNTVEARCVHTHPSPVRYEYTDNPPANVWSLYTCTWDGSEFCAYRWTSDTNHQHYCHHPAMPDKPVNKGTNGLAIGHLSDAHVPLAQLAGAVDNLVVFDHGLDEPGVCALAGKPAGCMPCDACEP